MVSGLRIYGLMWDFELEKKVLVQGFSGFSFEKGAVGISNVRTIACRFSLTLSKGSMIQGTMLSPE